jgi:hypothetical protein
LRVVAISPVFCRELGLSATPGRFTRRLHITPPTDQRGTLNARELGEDSKKPPPSFLHVSI